MTTNLRLESVVSRFCYHATFWVSIFVNSFSIHGHLSSDLKESQWRDYSSIVGYFFLNIGLSYFRIVNPYKYQDFVNYFKLEVNSRYLNFKLNIYHLYVYNKNKKQYFLFLNIYFYNKASAFGRKTFFRLDIY
jgi:hypothetical protein